jgi:hypothetical protein
VSSTVGQTRTECSLPTRDKTKDRRTIWSRRYSNSSMLRTMGARFMLRCCKGLGKGWSVRDNSRVSSHPRR